MIEVIDSGKAEALTHMQQDIELLQDGVKLPVLRFYQWARLSVTYGYFIKPEEWIKPATIASARRPTGGGLIFHDQDLSFTLALPLGHPICQLAPLERYKVINRQVLEAFRAFQPDGLILQEKLMQTPYTQLCMANPTKYDLLLGGKKVGGSAQRQTKRGFIHQSSLFLFEPPWDRIAHSLLEPVAVLPALIASSGSLFKNFNIIYYEGLQTAIARKINEII